MPKLKKVRKDTGFYFSSKKILNLDFRVFINKYIKSKSLVIIGDDD